MRLEGEKSSISLKCRVTSDDENQSIYVSSIGVRESSTLYRKLHRGQLQPTKGHEKNTGLWCPSHRRFRHGPWSRAADPHPPDRKIRKGGRRRRAHRARTQPTHITDHQHSSPITTTQLYSTCTYKFWCVLPYPRRKHHGPRRSSSH